MEISETTSSVLSTSILPGKAAVLETINSIMLSQSSAAATCTPLVCERSDLGYTSPHLSTPVKTVPFFPRVLLSVQPPLPLSAIATHSSNFQSNATSSDFCHIASNLTTTSPVSSTTSTVVTTVKNGHFFPLLLTTSTSPSISSYTPSSVQINTTTSTVASTVTEFVEETSRSNLVTAHHKITDASGSSSVTGSSSSLITSVSSRTNSAHSASVASIVISPSSSNVPQSAFTLRLTPNHSIHCPSPTPNPVSSSGCSLVFDTTVLSNQLTPASYRSSTITICSSPSTVAGSVTSNSLLVPSDGSSSPRFLIQKALPGHLSQASSTSAVDICAPLTFVAAVDVPPCIGSVQPTIPKSTCEQPGLQVNWTPQKAKLVSVAPSLSANVRLLATPTSRSLGTSTSGTFQMNSLIPPQPLISPLKTGHVGVWPGTASTHVATPASVVAIHPSQPLLTPVSSDIPVSISASAHSAQAHSMSTCTTVNSHLHGTTPTVLAFSLTSSAPSTSVPVTNLINPLRQISQGSHAPLLLRASCSPLVAFPPGSSAPSPVAPITSTSLLKPFNVSIASGCGVAQTFSTPSLTSSVTPAVLPHLVPVNIAPVKLSALQVTTSTSVFRSQLPPSNTLISSPRHTSTSIFSQPSRKRARKQQLASLFPDSVVASSPPASASCPATVSVSGSPIISTALTLQSSSNRTVISSTANVGIPTKHQPIQSTPLTSVLCTTQSLCGLPKPLSDCGEMSFRTARPFATRETSLSTNTSTAGLFGIRLLPLHSNPATPCPHSSKVSVLSDAQSYPSPRPTSLVSSDPESTFVMSPSSLRVTSQPLSSSDLQPTPEAAVYVLASSAYPVNSSNTCTTVVHSPGFSGSTDNFLDTSNSSNYSNALLMSGGSAASVLQVRFRPCFSTGTANAHAGIIGSNFSPIWPDSHSSHNVGSLPPLATCCTTEVVNQPRICSESSPLHHEYTHSDSLLHRHLLSPQNSTHMEPVTEEYCLATCSEIKENSCDAVIYRTANSRDTKAGFWEHAYAESSYGDSSSVSIYPLSTVKEGVNATEESEVASLSVKRPKITEEHYDVKQPLDMEVLTASEFSSCRVDLAKECEWVLTGLPSKPSIIPRPPASTYRSETVWRSKASHFLNSLEIREKSDSRPVKGFLSGALSGSSFPSEEDTSFVGSRCRRRATFHHSSSDHCKMVDMAVPSTHISAAHRRVVHDLLSLWVKQKDLQLIHFPLTVSSVLSLTGWRAFSCASNLDLLVSSEHQTLQTVELLTSDLDNWLRKDLGHLSLNQASDSSRSPHVVTDHCRPLPFLSSSIKSAYENVIHATVGHADSLERISTATVLSSMSTAKKSATYLNSDVHRDLEKALDLAKGISQRKRCLVKSIRRLQVLTKNVFEHFRTDAVKHFDDLEEQYNLLSSPAFAESIITSNTTSHPMGLRRSTRNSSPVPLSNKHVRSRNIELVSDSDDSSLHRGRLLHTGDPKLHLCNGVVGSASSTVCR